MLPTFYTERLKLRPRVVDDLEHCIAMDRDPEVVRYIDGPWLDSEKHKEFVLRRITTDYPEGLGYWTVCNNTGNHEFLGWILLIPMDEVGPDIEIGWRFIRNVWGKGYATEAACAILNYAFETVGITEVVADIHADNIGSRRVAEKVGLQQSKQQNESNSTLRYSLSRNLFLSR